MHPSESDACCCHRGVWKFSYLTGDVGEQSVLQGSHAGIGATAVCKTKVRILGISFFSF